jgi:hypothetical protein
MCHCGGRVFSIRDYLRRTQPHLFGRFPRVRDNDPRPQRLGIGPGNVGQATGDGGSFSDPGGGNNGKIGLFCAKTLPCPAVAQ